MKTLNHQQQQLTLEYPYIAFWIKEGSVEITSETGRNIIARAANDERIIWEGEQYSSFDEAMLALETGIEEWMKDRFRI
jgi:hypothetical protein